MTSTEFTSNQRSTSQSVFKGKINYNQQNIESKPPSSVPSYLFPPPVNKFIFGSNFSNKNFPYDERFKSQGSFKGNQEDGLFRKSFIQLQNPNRYSSNFEFQIPNQSREQSQFFSKLLNTYEKKLIFEPNNLILNYVEPKNGQDKEEPKQESIFGPKFEKKAKIL